jgi:hypothetical protein
MAIHDIPASMLKESLDESLVAAKYCVTYKKVDIQWGQFATGGCLGYPGAVLLFSIVDTIGSYFRKNPDFKITIDGKEEKINADGWEHFKILNSRYFSQTLSAEFIKKLYSNFRSRLIHNSILGDGTLMLPDNDSLSQTKGRNQAFMQGTSNEGKVAYIISLKEFAELCDNAVILFKDDIDDVVPNSKSGKKFT